MEWIDPQSLSEKERYKLLTGTVIPRPIAFVTTVSDDAVVNAAPFSYFNLVSSTPPILAISVNRQPDGSPKDTARNILSTEAFVVHIPSRAIIEGVNEAAARLPAEESEIPRTGFTLTPSETVSVPGIAEASVRYECTLHAHVPLGEAGETPSADLLLGRITAVHLAEGIRDDKGYIDSSKVDPVARLAGNAYATLGDIFSIKRPT